MSDSTTRPDSSDLEDPQPRSSGAASAEGGSPEVGSSEVANPELARPHVAGPAVPRPEVETTRTPQPLTRGERAWSFVREMVIVVVLAMVLSFIVKTWLLQAFYIPSQSMENTLIKNDRVIVSKLTPGPFDLKRGDIIVFEDPDNWLADLPKPAADNSPLHKALVFVGLVPDDAENHLIKRVIGLPGDHVQSDGKGKLKINGVAIDESSYIKPGDQPSEGHPFDIVVPAGKVWAMGDHRSDSADSRFHDDGTGKTGSVPIDDIVGRAVVIVWPLDRAGWLSNPSEVFAKVPNPNPVAALP